MAKLLVKIPVEIPLNCWENCQKIFGDYLWRYRNVCVCVCVLTLCVSTLGRGVPPCALCVCVLHKLFCLQFLTCSNAGIKRVSCFVSPSNSCFARKYRQRSNGGEDCSKQYSPRLHFLVYFNAVRGIFRGWNFSCKISLCMSFIARFRHNFSANGTILEKLGNGLYSLY